MVDGVKLCVVGTGYWGRNLVRNFDGLGVLEALCEASPETAASIANTFSEARVLSDVGAVVADPSLNAVAIATPAVTHGALVRQFLEADRHVFVEKPLCLDPREASELGDLAEARSRTLMVGHLLLYHPAFRALQSLVATGQVGQLRYIYSNRASLGKVRTEENALWSFAPHDVSMILALTGRMPERVIASGANYLTDGVADTTLSHLTFSHDLQAHIFVSWLHPYKEHRMVVVGSEGMIVFNDVAEGEDKLLLYPHVSKSEGGVPVINRAEAKPISYEAAEPLHLECAHFLDCVISGNRPLSDAAEGARVLRVLKACEESITTMTSVQIVD